MKGGIIDAPFARASAAHIEPWQFITSSNIQNR